MRCWAHTQNTSKTVSIYTKIGRFLAIFRQILGQIFYFLSRSAYSAQTPLHKNCQKMAILGKKCDGGWLNVKGVEGVFWQKKTPDWGKSEVQV